MYCYNRARWSFKWVNLLRKSVGGSTQSSTDHAGIHLGDVEFLEAEHARNEVLQSGRRRECEAAEELHTGVSGGTYCQNPTGGTLAFVVSVADSCFHLCRDEIDANSTSA